MGDIQWDKDRVVKFLFDTPESREFARCKTPRGWVTKARKEFGVLRKRCFIRSLQVAMYSNNSLYYCEGLAGGTPHAWVSPKDFDEDWCFDLTWPWTSPKFNGMTADHVPCPYIGLRFDPLKVRLWILNRIKKNGPCTPSLFKHIGEWTLEELT